MCGIFVSLYFNVSPVWTFHVLYFVTYGQSLSRVEPWFRKSLTLAGMRSCLQRLSQCLRTSGQTNAGMSQTLETNLVLRIIK